jgi:hypothetical protein
MDFRVNIEALHEAWLADYERLALDYFRRTSSGKKSKAVLVRFSSSNPDDDLAIYECMGAFDLPWGSGRLLSYMARSSMTNMLYPDEVIGSPFPMPEFPRTTFLVSSVLEASFPKNTRTGIFRGHNGGMLVSSHSYVEAEADVGRDAALGAVFAGLGVILMSVCRSIINPSAPDSGVVDEGENVYLCILEDDREEKAT